VNAKTAVENQDTGYIMRCRNASVTVAGNYSAPGGPAMLGLADAGDQIRYLKIISFSTKQ